MRRPDWRHRGRQAGQRSGQADRAGAGCVRHRASRSATPLYGVQALHNEDMAAALCRAVNDWMAREWLDREPRLRASILVPLQDAGPGRRRDRARARRPPLRAGAAARPWATRRSAGARYWPIYAAAERHGLPLGIHAGSTTGTRRSPATAGRPTISKTRGAVARLPGAAAQPDRRGRVRRSFPRLRVVLIEAGFTWLPHFLWRANKTWRGVRAEVPWVDRAPAEIIREHVRLTLQPIDAPPDAGDWRGRWSRSAPTGCCCSRPTIRTGISSGDGACRPGFPEALLRRMLVDNPLRDLSAAAGGRAMTPDDVRTIELACTARHASARSRSSTATSIRRCVRVRDLYPFLAQRWRDHLDTYGLRLPVPFTGIGAVSARRRRRCRAPMPGRRTAAPPGSDLDFMRAQLLDANGIEFGMLHLLAPTRHGPAQPGFRRRAVPRHQRVAGRDLDRSRSRG